MAELWIKISKNTSSTSTVWIHSTVGGVLRCVPLQAGWEAGNRAREL